MAGGVGGGCAAVALTCGSLGAVCRGSRVGVLLRHLKNYVESRKADIAHMKNTPHVPLRQIAEE